LIFSHTKHLSENYFAAANHCTQFSLSTRVDGYMRGAGLSEVRKVETTSGVYLRTPRAPASPDAQWAPGTVSAPYAPVMISPPRVSLVTLEWWRPPYEPVAMSPFRVLLLRWSGGGPPMYHRLRPPVRNLSARWSRGRPLDCGGC
jgi:hypothetical protein